MKIFFSGKIELVQKCLIILFSLFAFNNYAQDSILKKGHYIFVEDRNLIEHLGKIGNVNDSSFNLIKSVRDSLNFSRKENLKITSVTENNIFKGKKITEDQFSQLSSTFATAFPLRKWQIYYSNSNLFYNVVRFGLGKKLSLAINSSIFLAPIGVTTRYSIRLNDHFYFAPELGWGSGSWLRSDLQSFHFGLRTSQGNSQRNTTLGAGYFNISGLSSFSKNIRIGDSIGIGYVNFSFNERFSKKFSLNTDFWYFNTSLFPLANIRYLKSEFYVMGVFLRSYNLIEKQWRFGMLFLVVKPAKRNWTTIPIPVVQYNYLIGK
ncbi:MAG: hypothetical protein ACK5D5_00485 [Bacteroidota bacterium]|jgi:hypothetical protein